MILNQILSLTGDQLGSLEVVLDLAHEPGIGLLLLPPQLRLQMVQDFLLVYLVHPLYLLQLLELLTQLQHLIVIGCLHPLDVPVVHSLVLLQLLLEAPLGIQQPLFLQVNYLGLSI